MQIDHLLIAVKDLDDTARELEARYGLRSVSGGRHPGWGTANRIVPLGDAYLELIAVVDRSEAAASFVGRWVLAAEPEMPKLFAWCARTDDLADVAARLGLRVDDGSRETPDGQILRWRIAGIENAAAEPALPFFIEWGPGTPHPGHAAASEQRIAEVRLRADKARLYEWLGVQDLSIRIDEGEPALTGVVISGPGGELTLSRDSLTAD